MIRCFCKRNTLSLMEIILLLQFFIFSFKRFDTEENYDFVSVGHGLSRDNRSSTVIFKHSGRKLPEQKKFNSIDNSIWVTFTADDWDTRPGFTIRVQDTEEFGKKSIWPIYINGVSMYMMYGSVCVSLAMLFVLLWRTKLKLCMSVMGRPPRPSKRPDDSFRGLNLKKQTNKQTKQSNNKDSASFSAHFALFDVNAPIIGMVRLYRYNCVFLCTKKWECNTLHKGFWEGKDLLDFGFHECYVIPNSLWASLTSGVGLAGH